TKQRDGKYKHNLPKTTFGMRAKYSVREPELQKLWDENHVFKIVAENITGSDEITKHIIVGTKFSLILPYKSAQMLLLISCSPSTKKALSCNQKSLPKKLGSLAGGNPAGIGHLDELSSIVMIEPYKHKCPYDWRTKKPTIFRATGHWFATVEIFRVSARNAINQVVYRLYLR
ncbi:isoleucine--tRNA ligase, chloroplastic/mitochondrial, partial [Tanacetum coccineum]